MALYILVKEYAFMRGVSDKWQDRHDSLALYSYILVLLLLLSSGCLNIDAKS